MPALDFSYISGSIFLEPVDPRASVAETMLAEQAMVAPLRVVGPVDLVFTDPLKGFTG
ncbi:hypothetical protein AAFM46_16750 (plasmid) [Arthrobacter sp. TMP15]|uniref:hypothetical protein n=1 Tax=Arthrobacter sp. TMP15 TaxID=3140789 RepID=UPI0031BB07A6